MEPGQPIDVLAFLERADISEEVKRRVEAAGEPSSDPLTDDDAEAAEAYRRMQAQILLELANLDRGRRNPSSDILGIQATYEGLVVAILDEGQGTYRIQIIDGQSGFSSTCAGYTPDSIRGLAAELAYAYLLKRDGLASQPLDSLPWRPIHVSDGTLHLSRDSLPCGDNTTSSTPAC